MKVSITTVIIESYQLTFTSKLKFHLKVIFESNRKVWILQQFPLPQVTISS
jgi:hypothetical protein